jgi:hypothetical protein
MLPERMETFRIELINEGETTIIAYRIPRDHICKLLRQTVTLYLGKKTRVNYTDFIASCNGATIQAILNN